jgi:hypothetical protein
VLLLQHLAKQKHNMESSSIGTEVGMCCSQAEIMRQKQIKLSYWQLLDTIRMMQLHFGRECLLIRVELLNQVYEYTHQMLPE